MKRTSIMVLVALSLGLTSAAAQQKRLRAGIDGTFAPHAMPNLQGELEGFNVDLIKELEKKLGERDPARFRPILRIDSPACSLAYTTSSPRR